MSNQREHESSPPSSWPQSVIFLVKPRLAQTFPSSLLSHLAPSLSTFAPKPTKHPSSVQIKRIAEPSHPAYGQFGLFARQKIKENELVIPYLGVIYASFIPEDGNKPIADEHAESDYDLSLLRLSAADENNPFWGQHVSIGVDAAQAGNAARFVNDYRGIKTSGPNAEFRVGRGEQGELRMEIWSLKRGISKGEEILVSYGKGWWGARRGL
ncbi:uncharacterized protein L203_103466 [Cryptococcus depauperatus CBS 7841]|uniref:Uncharacterized protein n=1 Tax=Cryptococcus depauperatus CBS 7841 TaxID=1295531 RepID=A0A1E3IIA8_9TREE|nr:hypothetical protein L203_02937 [Cryptococcus depauperatus CBS 7841]